MSAEKCFHCGLVNFADAVTCKRCGISLDAAPARHTTDDWTDEPPAHKPRGFIKRVAAIVGMTVFLLLLFYMSLLETSETVTLAQRQTINRAIAVIERRGFKHDAFILRHLTNFRTTDNWWNRWLGHGDAYAATNFPFEVVTLYPDFFKLPTDDTERAVILLHEARHLSGADEQKAFSTVWRDRHRLGWTKETHGTTHVWKNVSEFTRRYAPQLFQCGSERHADCTE
ncbi:MAG TPA: hypothetical protein VF666_14520 [Pyrinomonadaceae bacterium]|jgi:hypothetical protein